MGRGSNQKLTSALTPAITAGSADRAELRRDQRADVRARRREIPQKRCQPPNLEKLGAEAFL
jgi:hypothetical protein